MTDIVSLTMEEVSSGEEIAARVHEVKNLAEVTAQEAFNSAAVTEESSSALSQVSMVVGNFSINAARINESIS